LDNAIKNKSYSSGVQGILTCLGLSFGWTEGFEFPRISSALYVIEINFQGFYILQIMSLIVDIFNRSPTNHP
jgi:hypothetical protein